MGRLLVLHVAEVEEVGEAAFEVGHDQHAPREGLDVALGSDEGQGSRPAIHVLLGQ